MQAFNVHVCTLSQMNDYGADAWVHIGATREQAHDEALEMMKDYLCERHAEETDPSYIVDWRSFTSVDDIVRASNDRFWSNCMDEFSVSFSVHTLKASDLVEA
jgi:hypothetical protein